MHRLTEPRVFSSHQLEGFGRLHRSHDAGQGRKNTHHRTQLVFRIACRKQALITGRVGAAAIEHRKLSVEADRGT